MAFDPAEIQSSYRDALEDLPEGKTHVDLKESFQVRGGRRRRTPKPAPGPFQGPKVTGPAYVYPTGVAETADTRRPILLRGQPIGSIDVAALRQVSTVALRDLDEGQRHLAVEMITRQVAGGALDDFLSSHIEDRRMFATDPRQHPWTPRNLIAWLETQPWEILATERGRNALTILLADRAVGGDAYRKRALTWLRRKAGLRKGRSRPMPHPDATTAKRLVVPLAKAMKTALAEIWEAPTRARQIILTSLQSIGTGWTDDRLHAAVDCVLRQLPSLKDPKRRYRVQPRAIAIAILADHYPGFSKTSLAGKRRKTRRAIRHEGA